MTWWLSRGCSGPNAGGFDPYAVPPVCAPFIWDGAPIPPPPVTPPLPLVGHKGDTCCGSCAEGQTCESECKDKKAQVGALYVSDAELDALGSQIALMNADVDQAAKKERTDSPGGERGGGSVGTESPIWVAQTGVNKAVANIAYLNCKDQGMSWDPHTLKCDLTKPDPDHLTTSASGPQFASWPLTKFLDERWSPLKVKWDQYRDDTIHAPTTFDQLRTEFATVRSEWTGPLKQTTSAVVPPPLSESSGANAIPWGWIALGVGIVAIPFVLPSLAAIYVLATKGKSLGAGGLGLRVM